MRVALFATCLVDSLFPEVGKATVALLARLGWPVEFPSRQVCCGQMQVNTGYVEQAAAIVRNHVEAFEGYDAVVAPSGSCVASVRHQQAMVAREAGDEALARRCEELGERTWELSEFLVDVLGIDDVGAHFPRRVAYHPTCHSLRLLRTGDRPLRLLGNVEGIELVEPASAETCCGFGGTFSVKNPEVSSAMLADKIAALISTGAEICTAGDSSCLMHIGGGLRRLRSGVATMHLAEILACTKEDL